MDGLNGGPFPTSVIHSGCIALGTATLRAGINQFVIESVGKSSASNGYMVGIDDLTLVLDPVEISE